MLFLSSPFESDASLPRSDVVIHIPDLDTSFVLYMVVVIIVLFSTAVHYIVSDAFSTIEKSDTTMYSSDGEDFNIADILVVDIATYL